MNFGGYANIWLLTIMTIAVVMDLTDWKIKNQLILLGLMWGFISQVCMNHTQTVLTYLTGITMPMILLYLLFLMRALGAGDIKLLSVAGGFLGIRGGLYCIFYSFVIGAALSAAKMIYQHNLWVRLNYLRSYIGLSLATHTFHEYNGQSDGKENRIHFSICILLGTILYLGVNH